MVCGGLVWNVANFLLMCHQPAVLDQEIEELIDEKIDGSFLKSGQPSEKNQGCTGI